MICLDNVTLLGIDTFQPDRTIFALNESKRHIKFASTILITSRECKFDSSKTEGISVIYNDTIDNFKKVNTFMLFDVGKYVNTEFVMFVEWDGYVLNPNGWNDKFLECDYIGATWTVDSNYKTWKNLSDILDLDKGVVGNSGFSIRSKRLIDFVSSDEYTLKQYDDTSVTNDMFICCKVRRHLIEEGFIFAEPELADTFSAEIKPYTDQFGWHGFWNKPSLPLDLLFKNQWIKNSDLMTKFMLRAVGK